MCVCACLCTKISILHIIAYHYTCMYVVCCMLPVSTSCPKAGHACTSGCPQACMRVCMGWCIVPARWTHLSICDAIRFVSTCLCISFRCPYFGVSVYYTSSVDVRVKACNYFLASYSIASEGIELRCIVLYWWCLVLYCPALPCTPCIWWQCIGLH